MGWKKGGKVSSSKPPPKRRKAWSPEAVRPYGRTLCHCSSALSAGLPATVDRWHRLLPVTASRPTARRRGQGPLISAFSVSQRVPLRKTSYLTTGYPPPNPCSVLDPPPRAQRVCARAR